MRSSQLRLSRTQRRLLVAIVVCYGVGYPVALVMRSAVGWVLVTLGGVFLICLGIVTVRQMHK